MNYRLHEILASESTATAATKTIDLDIADPISSIVLTFKGTNNGSTPTAHPAKMVTKIELVDGSDVLFSLSGIEAQALNYYERGKMAENFMVFSNDIMAIAVYEINFGRWLWDEMLALDPKKFTNPQLKITHNKANGGSSPDASTMGIQAFLFDEKKISPVGFLMSKEIMSYALANSAHEYIDLPVDYAYRRLIIQSLSAGQAPHEQYNKIKLSEDGDKRVIINNLSTSDLVKLLQRHTKIIETIRGIGTGADVTHYITPTYNSYITIGAISTDLGTVNASLSEGGSVTVNVDSGEHFQARVEGICPHGALEILFGKEDSVDDVYNVSKVGNLKLDITAGSSIGASSTAEIVVQQLRRY